jgi:hypothetical protein
VIEWAISSLFRESSTDRAKVGLVQPIGLDELDGAANGEGRAKLGVYRAERRVARYAERRDYRREERTSRITDRPGQPLS